MSATPVCRHYRPDDREGLVSLWVDCGLVRPWNNPYRDIDRKLSVDADGLLVLEWETRLIGSVMIGYEGHRGWVNYLAVHPDFQRQGLGRLLMTKAEAHLVHVGCPKVNLQVRATNLAAIEFYRRIGYSSDDVVSSGHRLEQDSQTGPPDVRIDALA